MQVLKFSTFTCPSGHQMRGFWPQFTDLTNGNSDKYRRKLIPLPPTSYGWRFCPRKEAEAPWESLFRSQELSNRQEVSLSVAKAFYARTQ